MTSSRGFAYASPPPPPRPKHEFVNVKDLSVPLFPAMNSSRKAPAQSVVISKRPEGLHFLMTPCSLRSLLPEQAYYTKFGACKSTDPEAEALKSSQRLRKVSFDLEPRYTPEEPK